MLEIDGLKCLHGSGGGSVRRGALRHVAGRRGPLAAVFLLYAIAIVSSAQIEYEPGEREAERLFEMGLGGPWIMSERHPEMYPREENRTWQSTSEFSLYSEYFSMTSPGGMEVERYDVSGVPEIYGAGPGGQPVIGSSHPPGYAGALGLWIMGITSWTEYAIVPQGAYLRLLALYPAGGVADLYEITPSDRLVQRRYTLYPGYSLLAFHPVEVGRYILLFSVDRMTSNVVVVDVRQGTWPATPPETGPQPGYGSSQVTLRSANLRGYSVYVDGSYVGADGQGGDVQDGIYSLAVPGGMSHTITVRGSGLTCRCDYFYASGRSYTIEVCST